MKVFYFAGQAEAFARLVAPLLREHETDGAIDAPIKDHTDLPDEPGNVFVVVQSQSAEIPALFYTALRAKGYTLWHVADGWARHRLEQDRLNADTRIPAGSVARHTVSGSDAADDDDMPAAEA